MQEVETWSDLKQRIVEWALANNYPIRSHTHPKTRKNWEIK